MNEVLGFSTKNCVQQRILVCICIVYEGNGEKPTIAEEKLSEIEEYYHRIDLGQIRPYKTILVTKKYPYYIRCTFFMIKIEVYVCRM